MAYGLRIFSPGTYNPIQFDSTTYTRFPKVVASGTLTLAGNTTSSSITATGYDAVYVTNPSVNVLVPITITRSSNSFTIRNNTSTSRTFAYVAFGYN